MNEFFLLFAEGFRGCEMPEVERMHRRPPWMLARLWHGRSVSEHIAGWYAENWKDL